MPLKYEDITIGSGATYVTGGLTLTITKANQIRTILNVYDASPTGTTTLLPARGVKGSESGQTFVVQLFGSGSATNQGPVELASASTLGENRVMRCLYDSAS